MNRTSPVMAENHEGKEELKREQRETVAEFITRGAYDCIEMGHVGHLPVAVHRSLQEKTLREERDRAKNGLGHSEARYRALAGNLSYGICRCDRHGKFLEVSEAMVKMLGYASKEELLAVNLASGLIQDLGKRAQLLGQPDQQGSVDPIEIEWKRKDHTTLKVRFLGQEILGAQGQLDAYEVITEDVTKQRQLEDHLRQQAARDPLTGLANCRHLAEVLDMEIKRSERTGRESALLVFDLDGLKQINDRYGHLTGSHAICRVAVFAGTSIRRRAAAATSLQLSCRKQASKQPTTWRNVSLKPLPMTARDQCFPSA